MTRLEVGRILDASDLPRANGPGACRLTPLRGRPLGLQTRSLDLSGLTLQTGSSTPFAVLGSVPAGTVWLLLPLDGHRTLLLGGRCGQNYGAAILGAGAEYEMANRNDASWGLVAMPAAAVRSLLSVATRPAFHRPGAIAWVRSNPDAQAQAAQLMRDAAEVMRADPEVFEVAEARRSLRASVIEACHELLTAPLGEAGRRVSPVGSIGLRRVVRAADHYLALQPARAADLAHLCQAIGVSETRLKAAFLAILGISPARYITARRLLMARAALRSSVHPTGSAEESALAHGFKSHRHLERAYRAMFGKALVLH